ncbi:hypothetical protein HY857_00125 [Candidatus Saccharibacteria bacterium]|nr:hypothetical protein [Candidatus Saccharibacteria bacterium]
MSSSEGYPGTGKEAAISEVALRIATAVGDHIAAAISIGTIEEGDEVRVMGRAIEKIKAMAAENVEVDSPKFLKLPPSTEIDAIR